MAGAFHGFDSFSHKGAKWVSGEFSNRINGTNDFVSVLHDAANKQNYGLKPEINKDTNTVTGVELVTTPHKPEAELVTLDPELREKFATTLEWSAKRAGMQVDAEVLQAVREGRDLTAERSTEADYNRLTRNTDHDLESAYILRDALREEANTALDEGRDADAKAAMEQLGEVKQSIQDYWNPHKERAQPERELTPKQEEDILRFAQAVEERVEKDAPRLAAAEFALEEIAATEQRDGKAAKAAGEKAEYYSGRARAAQGQESFADRERQRAAERGENGRSL